MKSDQEIACEILEQIEAISVPNHEYVPAAPENFRHVSLSFYDTTQRLLEAQGFRFIADVEDLTVSEAPGGVRTFMRLMLSADGLTQVAIYHLRPGLFLRICMRLMGGGSGKEVDFETSFSDGHFMTTTNAYPAGAMSSPPEFHNEYLPAKTRALDILARHTQRVEEYLSASPGVQAFRLQSITEMLMAQHKQEALKAAHRQAVGLISREELRGMAGRDTQTADLVYEEIQHLRGNDLACPPKDLSAGVKEVTVARNAPPPAPRS